MKSQNFFIRRFSVCDSPRYFIARFYSVFIGKSGVYFDYVNSGFRGRISLFRKRFRVFLNVNDNSVFINENHIERNNRVFHPKRLIVFVRKNEKHTLIFLHMFTIHQSANTFFLRVRKFDVDGRNIFSVCGSKSKFAVFFEFVNFVLRFGNVLPRHFQFFPAARICEKGERK